MDIQSNTCKIINIDKKTYNDIIKLKNEYLKIKEKIYKEIYDELDLKNKKVIINK
tara:strand:+ start:361 stop:525 length:165 start_codon:yes stop_codon:yes gene_type:complete